MASSVLTHPEATLRALRGYELEDEDDILDFLRRYPTLIPLLREIREAIPKFFGEEAVTLEVSRDPEWPEDERLVANIQTHFGPVEALDHLKRFDREWWLAKRKDVDAPILVSIELVRRV